jgi:hypothetical protein
MDRCRCATILCSVGKLTVSLLLQFALPFRSFGISMIGLFLVARFVGRGLCEAAGTTCRPSMALPALPVCSTGRL